MSNIPLRTISQFCEENDAFTVGGVRWLVFNECSNGLKQSGAIYRVGRRVLINPEKFFAWIEKKQTEAA